MVLFWKQVHLQKEGTAEDGLVLCLLRCWGGGMGSWRRRGDGVGGGRLTCAGEGCQDGEEKEGERYARHCGVCVLAT